MHISGEEAEMCRRAERIKQEERQFWRSMRLVGDSRSAHGEATK
jgi:hypothetical protein